MTGGFLTSTELQDIKDRAEAATPGPWSIHYEDAETAAIYPNCYSCSEDGRRHWYAGEDLVRMTPNANTLFIAAAREDVPALLAHIDALTKALHSNRYINEPVPSGEETP